MPIFRPRMSALAPLGLLALALVLVACDTSEGGATTASPPQVEGGAQWVDDPFSGGYPTYQDEASGITVVFGTPDLGVGPSRVSFALFDREGLVALPTVDVATRFYADDTDGYEPGEQTSLRFHPFPLGGRGIYTGTLTFDAPGLWAIEARIPRAEEPPRAETTVLFPVEVAAAPVAPAVGSSVPASNNRTSADTEMAELTTSTEPDPTLYDTTIADALKAGRPFVVTFASPAFCTNALCGPQVEVTSELAREYEDRAEFIHVELYENPTEIRGDLSVARRTPVLEEWGIHTDEWTFVVDADGLVAARFEGFAPRDEVEAALLAVLAALDAPAGQDS
ncbi:MAG: hypothetical protein M0R73_00670 [Dehalococcoidia bacterium]|nr:hypothetical protein [Dehalococcoidia bacterium]